MSKTLNFLRLDFKSIQQYLTIKQLGLYVIVILFLSYTMDNSFFVIGMIMMYGLFYAAYPFAIGDKTQTDILYTSLPLKKQHIVVGRYLFAICINMITAVTAVVLSGLIGVIFHKEIDLLASVITVLICLFLYVFVEAVQFPIYFKLGYTKAKVIAFLPIFLIPFLIALLTSLIKKDTWMAMLSNLFVWAQEHMILVIVALLILLCLVMLLSAVLSYRIYQKRDF